MPPTWVPPTSFTVKEAADRLRVDPITIRRWIRSGRLKAFKLPGGEVSSWRIPIEVIEEIEGGSQNGVAAL
jgi:excisionase family DNA binding protein